MGPRCLMGPLLARGIARHQAAASPGAAEGELLVRAEDFEPPLVPLRPSVLTPEMMQRLDAWAAARGS